MKFKISSPVAELNGVVEADDFSVTPFGVLLFNNYDLDGGGKIVQTHLRIAVSPQSWVSVHEVEE